MVGSLYFKTCTEFPLINTCVLLDATTFSGYSKKKFQGLMNTLVN